MNKNPYCVVKFNTEIIFKLCHSLFCISHFKYVIIHLFSIIGHFSFEYS